MINVFDDIAEQFQFDVKIIQLIGLYYGSLLSTDTKLLELRDNYIVIFKILSVSLFVSMVCNSLYHLS